MSSIPFFAKRFVAGSTLDQTFPVIAALNEQGIAVTLDALGENVPDRDRATACTNEYLAAIQAIKEKNFNSYISLKLTMIGLDIDEDFCLENLNKILTLADQYQCRICLDMEGSAYTERTISMYEKVAKTFQSPEIVLQAYLLRTEKDLQRVLAANGRMRLCKGAYKEPPEKAFQTMPLIIENYKKLVQILLISGKRICIATHDDGLIAFCKKFIAENNIPKERYEFQMLYGLRQKTWSDLRAEGHNMTVYVPYGTDWKAYYKRRLSERKENIFFIIKNFFKS